MTEQSPYDFGFGIDWNDVCVYRHGIRTDFLHRPRILRLCRRNAKPRARYASARQAKRNRPTFSRLSNHTFPPKPFR